MKLSQMKSLTLGILLMGSCSVSELYMDAVKSKFGCQPGYVEASGRLLHYPADKRRKKFNEFVRFYGLYDGQTELEAISQRFGVL